MKNMKFILIAVLVLGMIGVGQGCSKKGPKPGDASASAADGGGPNDPNSTTGRQLTPEQERIEARDAKYAETSALQDVYFDYDKSDLRSDSSKVVDANAQWMKSNTKMKVQIEGHCDERGTEEYNLALGERRATAVKNHMISLGVEPKRLFTISYGEELPLDPGHTEDAWSKNRRAHFVATEANF